MMVEEKVTVWDQRFRRLKKRVRETTSYQKIQEMQSKIRNDEFVGKIKDKAHDVRDRFETSQHPLIWKVRDIQDALTNETETGMAIGEILRVDPSFDLVEWMEWLEEEIVPGVIEAFLRADDSVIAQVFDEPALSQVRGLFRHRKELKIELDPRVLYVSKVDLASAKMEETPILIVQFVCHQVKKQDKIQSIQMMHYEMGFKRDLQDQEFGWKIVRFGSQEMQGIRT